jgi:hypothetical protein
VNCRACACPGPVPTGRGAAGLGVCKCGHLVVIHEGHGVPFDSQVGKGRPFREMHG